MSGFCFNHEKIFLLDDSKSFLAIFKQFLEKEGLQVSTYLDANSLTEAVKIQSVDAIICDYEMPHFNGIEFIKTMKSDPKTSGIPILMVTGKSDIEVFSEAVLAGAESVTTKENLSKMIIPQVYSLLRIRKLHLEHVQESQLQMVKKLIGTYKHEFGNVLSILFGKHYKLGQQYPQLKMDPAFQSIEKNLHRINETLNKLNELRNISEDEYGGIEKILKIG